MLKAFFQKKLAYFELNIEFSASNEIVVLLGPSGAGKTTVLHCLAGLIQPAAGEITLNGKTIFSTAKGINIPARLRRIGYLFQDYALFPHMTVEHNVSYGIPHKRKWNSGLALNTQDILNIFKISHLKNRYPGQLSGGEKQRVALARALMVQPELLLLDEPLSALDRATRRELQSELKDIQERWRIPFILVTHDDEEAGILGSKIITLEAGKVSNTFCI